MSCAQPADSVISSRFGSSSFLHQLHNPSHRRWTESASVCPHRTAVHCAIHDGRAYELTRHSAKCLIESDDRDIDISLALGDRVLCLKLSAFGI